MSAFPGLGTIGAAPNLEPRDSIRITESAPVVRLTGDQPQLTLMRWSWPSPSGKPVYNFRSEGRRFSTGRCLIPADGFYEFTDPEPPAPKRARKVRWLFTMREEPWFCIAGLWRANASAGSDAWTMLTCEAGPDVAPYHSRQVVVLGAQAAQRWLADESPETLLHPSMAGSLQMRRAEPAACLSPQG